MVALCRHIMPSNKQCGSPALKGQDFCYNHQLVKRVTQPRPRNPNDFTYVIPFVYPEDRAAINHNLFLVLRAQAEYKIDTRMANSMTANLRAAAINLNRGPLLEEDRANAVQRVILTPEGDEIAPPREALEEGESPLHDKSCPCQRCAEEFRNAPPEQHHADCRCGLCDEPTDQLLTNGCHPERSETQCGGVEEPALSMPKGSAFSRPTHENGCPIFDAPFAARACPEPAEGVGEQERLESRTAPAMKIHSYELPDSTNQEINLINEIYREAIEKYKADSTARAQAAIDAGLEPPRPT